MARDSPPINHLFFTDDSIVFCKVNLDEWCEIQSILDFNATTFGQEINKHKISIFLSSNTNQAMQDHLLNVAGISLCTSQEKYLELSIMVVANKYQKSLEIKDWVWAKASTWKKSFLSQASKEVLLLSVVQVIPTYTMSLFLLPRKICKGIISSMSNLWWDHLSKTYGFH